MPNGWSGSLAPPTSKFKEGNGATNVFTPEKRIQFIEEFAKCGSQYKAAAKVGIQPRLVYDWRRNNEEFRDMFARAQEALVDALEKEAYRRAVKGIKKGVHYQGDKVDEEKVYSDKLLVTLLRANAPDRYRYRDFHEDDASVRTETVTVNINTVPTGNMIQPDRLINGSSEDATILDSATTKHSNPGTSGAPAAEPSPVNAPPPPPDDAS